MWTNKEMAGRTMAGRRRIEADAPAEIDYEYVLLCCLHDAQGHPVSGRQLVQALVAAGHRPVTARHLVATTSLLARSGRWCFRARPAHGGTVR